MSRAPAMVQFQPKDRIVVRHTHGTAEFRGQPGQIVHVIPFGKYAVELDNHGRQVVDYRDLSIAPPNEHYLVQPVYLKALGRFVRIDWICLTAEAANERCVQNPELSVIAQWPLWDDAEPQIIFLARTADEGKATLP